MKFHIALQKWFGQWLAAFYAGVFLFSGCTTRNSSPEPAVVTVPQNLVNASRTYAGVFVNCVSANWYKILDEPVYKTSPSQAGTVTVSCVLHSNGTLSDFKNSSETVAPLFRDACEKAVRKCAPMQSWSPEMIQIIGTNSCTINLTFYYDE